MQTISIKTHKRNEMIDISDHVRHIIAESGVRKGSAIIFVPHTTAAVTINENADPDVVHDLLLTLEELVEQDRRGYRHGEGNSDAHVKSSLIGSSLTVIVDNAQPVLGTWQGIYFCEFDGPRQRRFIVETQSA